MKFISARLAITICVSQLAYIMAVTPAHADHNTVGEIWRYRAFANDNLAEIALQTGLGYTELVAANPGVDPWLLGEGTEIVLPMGHILPAASHEGIVINLADQRLYYFGTGTHQPLSFAIGIGRQGWDTPLGTTRVTRKRVDPAWRPPASIRALNPELPAYVAPGPENPLGTRALDLGWPAYLIHGTNKPLGIGRRVSSGCIRLYPQDIETLYDLVPVGTPVTVVDQPLKIAWVDDGLYIEVHPTTSQAVDVAQYGFAPPDEIPDAVEQILFAAGEQRMRIDLDRMSHALVERTGVPTRITF